MDEAQLGALFDRALVAKKRAKSGDLERAQFIELLCSTPSGSGLTTRIADSFVEHFLDSDAYAACAEAGGSPEPPTERASDPKPPTRTSSASKKLFAKVTRGRSGSSSSPSPSGGRASPTKAQEAGTAPQYFALPHSSRPTVCSSPGAARSSPAP